MMVKTKGGIKIKDFGKFNSQDILTPPVFRGKVEVNPEVWEDAEWKLDGTCSTHNGDDFFIGQTRHTPTKEDELFYMSGDEKLERAFFFIQADSHSRSAILMRNRYEKEEKYKLDWIQDGSGIIREVGKLYRKNGDSYEAMPVMVTFFFAILNGVYVAFYSSDSMVTDWKMVEDYVRKYAGQYDSASRTAMTNAENFHHCSSYCLKPH